MFKDLLLIILICCFVIGLPDAYAQPRGGAPSPRWKEVDGSPSSRPRTIVVSPDVISFSGNVMSLDVIGRVSLDNTSLNPSFNSLGVGIIASEVTGEVDVSHTATENDEHTMEIDTNAAGFGDVKALNIDYITGTIAAGEDEGIILINIDEIAAGGGDVFGLEVLATEGSADVYGMKVGAVIGPIHQNSGTFVNPTTATDNTTGPDDVDAMKDGSTGTTTAIFESNNEYIIIGAATAFEEMEVVLTTGASGAGIKPKFEYSEAGAGSWSTAAFSPVDGTNGFRNTGVIAWDASDLTSHGINTDTGTYDIRITRTRVALGTTPVLGYAKVASTTEYIWTKEGDVNINELDVTKNISCDTITCDSASVVNDLAVSGDVVIGGGRIELRGDTDDDGIVFGSLGTATKAIDFSGFGLSGWTDYLWHYNANNYLNEDGYLRIENAIVTNAGTAYEVIIGGSGETAIKTGATDLDLEPDANSSVTYGRVSMYGRVGKLKVGGYRFGDGAAVKFLELSQGSYANDTGTLGGVSNILLVADTILGGDAQVLDFGTLGSEVFNETDFATHTKWDVTGDFDDTGGDAEYIHSTGSGTLTQTAANMATALVGSSHYLLTYTISGYSDSSFTACEITTGILDTALGLTTWNGDHTTYLVTKETPGDFVISVTSNGTCDFTLDDISLKQIIGGDLLVHGDAAISGDVTAFGQITDGTDYLTVSQVSQDIAIISDDVGTLKTTQGIISDDAVWWKTVIDASESVSADAVSADVLYVGGVLYEAGGGWDGTTNLTITSGVRFEGGWFGIGNAGTAGEVDGDGDLYVEQELEVDNNVHFQGFNIDLDDGVALRFGTGIEMEIEQSTTGNDSVRIALDVGGAAQSGNLIINEIGDNSVDFGQPIVADPHLRIQSASTTDEHFIQFWHDQTDAHIQGGAGNLMLSSAGKTIVSADTAGTDIFDVVSGDETSCLLVDKDRGVHMPYLKSGTDQAAAGAVAGELWVDTDDANTIKLGT